MSKTIDILKQVASQLEPAEKELLSELQGDIKLLSAIKSSSAIPVQHTLTREGTLGLIHALTIGLMNGVKEYRITQGHDGLYYFEENV